MVDAELCFGDAVAAQGQLAVLDVVVGAQVRETGVKRGLADRIAVDHALGTKLMVLAVAILVELETIGFGLGAIFGFAIQIAESPPPPRQAV